MMNDRFIRARVSVRYRTIYMPTGNATCNDSDKNMAWFRLTTSNKGIGFIRILYTV